MNTRNSIDRAGALLHIDIPNALTQCINNAEMGYFAIRRSLMAVKYGNGTKKKTTNMLNETLTKQNSDKFAGKRPFKYYLTQHFGFLDPNPQCNEICKIFLLTNRLNNIS